MLHKFNAGYKQRTDLWTKRQGLSEILFGRPNTTDKVAIEMHCNLKAPPGVAPVVLGFFGKICTAHVQKIATFELPAKIMTSRWDSLNQMS